MIARLPEECAGLIEGGKRLGGVLAEVAKRVVPGVSSAELNELAERLIREKGDAPAFLGYTPDSATRPYPAALCVSINDEVVHGIPGDKIFNEGDVVSIDLGVNYKGFFTDGAVTVLCGSDNSDGRSNRLISVCREALNIAIKECKSGARTGDIGHAVEKFIQESGFRVFRELVGHGVGRAVH